MKLLFLSFNQEGKGSFLRAFALAKELAALGHELSICCASPTNTFEEKSIDDIKLFCFPWGKKFLHGYNLPEIIARKRWLGQQQFDFVHTFDIRPSCAYPALQAQRNGAIFVSDWADWFGRGGSVEERTNPITRVILRFLETYFERNLRRKTSATTAICKQLYALALKIGISQENLILLPNGFDQNISPTVSKEEARQTLGLDINTHIVGSLGAFFHQDFVLLNDIIKLVKSQKDVKFIHIGQKPKKLDCTDLHYTGQVSDDELSLYLQACDLLHLPMANLPANHGRLPLKFSDYISAGRPVLSSKVGDVPHFIESFHVGFVANPDAKSYTTVLLEALNHPDLLIKSGENALSLSRKPGYRWQDRAQDLQEFYVNLQERKNIIRQGKDDA